MHLYNAWLPPAVAAETRREGESFASVVRSVKETWRQDDPDSVYSTLKWISIIDLFVKAKSEVSPADVRELLVFGLDVFHSSQNKLHVQVRWGSILVKLLKKHGKKLGLSIEWRPFYDCLTRTHFKRNTGPEGWRLRQRHFETVTSLVRTCRRFFPAGAAAEIWSEFRALMENPWHNSTFEGSGFVQLFLPVNAENQNYFTSCWIKECLDLWETLPNCQFWDIQWTTLLARCIKSCKAIDWEQFLPALFSRYLNMFEVPVSSGSGSYPFPLEVPRNMKFLFSSKSGVPAKAIAKSIVYLLKPGSSAQEYFERLANLLEQYYHPSNGGRWTYSLERFLRYLVISLQKRLQHEQLNQVQNKPSDMCLGKPERASFVKVLLKLIDRGQYSKNESLAETVAGATSVLSYVEPSLVLPFVASRFQMALETLTATHQLKSAVTSVAFAGRALFLASLSTPLDEDHDNYDVLMDLIVICLSNALLGMDANDPPKTLATLQLIGSIFSNLTSVGGNDDGPPFLQSINFSEWLDEFFCRLFSLLQHLEQTSVTNEVPQNSTSSGTFLAEESPYYFCMLQILLGKLSKPLFDQSLRKISKFVNSNILPGATTEVGLLCCACVLSNSEEAAVHLIKPILMAILSSFEGTPISGFGGGRTFDASVTAKATLSPALETALEYYLKVLAIAISYGGPGLLQFRDDLKLAIESAFQAPSWKVNGAGNHVLRSLLGSLIFYYPIDQFKPFTGQLGASFVEEWLCSKISENEVEKVSFLPRWHIPSHSEVSFATELLDLHFRSALDDLLRICQTKMHTDAGDEKEHLKVTLLRIYSSLQGVMSCLPDMCPSYKNRGTKDIDLNQPFIAGAVGSCIGNSEMRERAAQQIHVACKYLLKERSDDSILLILIIRVMDALGNFGSLEYEEWSSHIHAWKLESAAIIEPPCNFIISSHTRGKKRPRWALIDKAYMHNTWRSSQSSYHRFRTDGNIFPSEHLVLLMEDLLDLSLHNYETVRSLAGRSLSKMLKRWPSLISKCVLTLSANLQDPKAPEHIVLGSCSVLATQTVLRHLTMDSTSFSAFIIGLLTSSHHESLKAQKAITELFVKYNIHFSGISRTFFKSSGANTEGPEFIELISQISSLGFDNTGLHWRYNLMANRVLLLLTLASRSDSHLSSKILGETAGHFLRNLKSQLPQSRILAISALNTLLQGVPHKISNQEHEQSSAHVKEISNSSTEGMLNGILLQDEFFSETLNSLSHVHIISDETSITRGNHGESSFQSLADKAITFFYFDFLASWPRTPSWISLYGGDTFYSNFARIFKRLIQECGTPVLKALQNILDEFSSAKERPKQCVAAEVMAGILHSDVSGVLEAWDEWMMNQLQKIMMAPSVETIPDWAACIRYAVTGKGKYGTRSPLLRQQILDCLMAPLSQSMATNVVSKRYAFLSVALAEISPPKMPTAELHFHHQLLEELLNNMSHSSAQVREAIGVTLAVLCSNLRLNAASVHPSSEKMDTGSVAGLTRKEDSVNLLTEGVSELAINILSTNHSDSMDITGDLNLENVSINKEVKADVRRMETMFHFLISSLRSARSSYMLDIIVKLLYPVISLQETSNKDLSTLAKTAFELLKWRALPQPLLESAVQVILSSVNDPNWRTRSACLSYLRIFMYRHTFILSGAQKQEIWNSIENLLVDNQVEVREHAAGVLAGLMKGGDEYLSKDFRDKSYNEAKLMLKKRKQRNSRSDQSIASTHGAILALAASVLSVPYDMPSWLPDHVTLLAQFIGEPSPIKSTVTKAVAEFRRTHADTWNIHKDAFTEEQLEVLADTSSSSSYFA
ncbi:proteasome activator subunit 4 isoform X2 [Canna indica]|uniref:Proteasome activator subunit 4 isoform X2 n=1 Tax=Canna indica TaxID=4628 RepID=A0AAQ3KSA7_9LILI|nr:proteasome activator subunit 4 isoform X2 [Canna indica]